MSFQRLRHIAIACLCIPSMAIAAPKRIVSLNMCADQLLIALADPGQIAALTVYARDPAMSAAAAQAAHLPVSAGHAEDVLAIDPDLILASPGLRQMTTMAALRGHDYPAIELSSAESIGAIREQIRIVAKAVGHPGRGERLIAKMDADLARIKPIARGQIAAYYQRRGYLTGTETLVDELMRRVGLRNLAAMLGKPGLARLSIEQMVAARPDYLIEESATRRVMDQGTEMLHHPALADIPRIWLPEAWTVCGGPAYVQAADSLAAQIAAHRAGHVRHSK